MCFEPQHNNLHFFDISTSRCALTKKSFQNFDFEMCLAPQRRAIFDSHPTRWLRTRRYSEPTFRHCRATKQWTQTAFRDFSTSSRILNFFLLALFFSDSSFSLSFFVLTLSLSPSLSLSSFSDSSHNCCASVHKLELWLLNFFRSLMD